jgi:hypothetical protein
MRTDDLIADLAGRATPVRPLPPPFMRASGWLVLAAACAAAGVMVFGARADVMVRLTQPDYLSIAVLAASLSAIAAAVSLLLAIPGAERRPLLRMTALAIFGVWTAASAWGVLRAGRGLPVVADPHWPVCFGRVALVALLPAVVLFVMARRGTPLRPGWTAAMAAVAAASAAALAVQLACPLDDAGHAFLGHLVPVMAMAATGITLRRTLTASPL